MPANDAASAIYRGRIRKNARLRCIHVGKYRLCILRRSEWAHADRSVLGCIKDVVEFAAELQMNPLHNPEPFHNVQIPVLEAGRTFRIAPEVADGTDSGRIGICRESDEPGFARVYGRRVSRRVHNIRIHVPGW